eukprot:11155308-Lingulodinium_polyedra.AAC.1
MATPVTFPIVVSRTNGEGRKHDVVPDGLKLHSLGVVSRAVPLCLRGYKHDARERRLDPRPRK